MCLSLMVILPVKIQTTTASCGIADCGVDLGPNCPAALKGPYDSTGFPVGCKSDCLVDPNPTNSPSCCSGQYSTPATCPSSGVPNYSYFKNNCPNSYVYAYDESSGTALWTYSSAAEPNYRLQHLSSLPQTPSFSALERLPSGEIK
ncbi:hypothetical protein FRB94_000675 [Tulasnella sp. JGI-2019a]|nr:hypothetical protein FRB94_000675 [Tulasnella sp. JGI-2019a]